MKKIICIGNRFAYPDNFGMKIYDKYKTTTSANIELIEGGIGGLNLALHFETDEPILIVDHGYGFKKRLFHIEELSLDFIQEYNHDTAFYYLLRTLKQKNIWLYLSNNKQWSDTTLDEYCSDISMYIEQL
ncbi:hypothetical protein JHD46_04755 [Sulfurimonas sp. SAG-AH-194-C20]|nr:hypothetical protein [Sulfurimonas sp. SAG-AH-194-C20]MDF1878946.1 hypothetical protein [Sulfurimonas sp. SAG-AH-194-C20]